MNGPSVAYNARCRRLAPDAVGGEVAVEDTRSTVIETAQRTIRIGVVGAGATTTEGHIPRFQAIEGVEVVSVANRSRESSQRVADKLGIPRVYDRWTDLVAAPDTDAICIGTWPYMHRPIVLAALQHGKHVLTEARMAMNAREAREMLEASRRRPDLVAQVVPALFTAKVDRTVRELIADGFLGELLAVDMAAHGGFIDRETQLTWRKDRDISGYNTMMVGSWYECLIRWVGPAASVTAMTRVNVPARLDDAGNLRSTDIPDHVEVLCEMESGPVAHMRFSDVVGLTPSTQMRLFGTEGTLRVQGNEDQSHWGLYGGRRGDDALSEIDVPKHKQGFWRVEEEFVNAIRGVEKVALNTFEVGVGYMEFTEAVARSAQSGKTVYLPL